VNPDCADLLAAFSAADVEFLVVGAHAMAAHGHVRATKDLDVWVRPGGSNASRVLRALRRFGAPLQDLSEGDLSSSDVVFQIGIDPVRIDVMTSIDGVEFEDAWRERLVATFDGIEVGVLSRRHLIQNKRATGRLQDLADVERLEREHPSGESPGDRG